MKRAPPVAFAPFYPQPNGVATTPTAPATGVAPQAQPGFASSSAPAYAHQHQPGTSHYAGPSVRGGRGYGRGVGPRGRGRGFSSHNGGRPPAYGGRGGASGGVGGRGAGPSSPFMSISLRATPVQPPSSPDLALVADATVDQPAAAAPTTPPPTVTHRVTRTLQRGGGLAPLDVHIFYGPISTFLEEYGSDVVITSSFKGGFRSPSAPSSFCAAAKACGVDVASLEYKDLISADYNLHMLEPEQCCSALWLVELKISSALSPFKPKDLVDCYDMLKLHSREIILEETETLTMPLIGKGSKANYFQTGNSEVIVELVGFLYWIAENMNDRPNLREINIITSKDHTAYSLQSAFDVLIPIQLDKLEEALSKVLPVTSFVLTQFENELKKVDQAEKAEREEKRSAMEQDGETAAQQDDTDIRLVQRDKRERRRKLNDVVTKLRIIHKSVDNIHAALQAGKHVREVSIIIVASALNGRIIAELCTELFLLQDGFLRPTDSASLARGHVIPSATGVPSAMPETMADNLWGRMMQLNATGKFEGVFAHFQTLRLIGNKAAHSSMLKATMVDLAAIVLAVRGILLSPHFAPGRNTQQTP